MLSHDIIPSLFRSEYGKMVAVLAKNFGLSNIQVAEDIVSDTFLVAAETWGMKGIPKNPAAWLYQVAKNKTKDYLKRENTFHKKIKTAFTSKTSSHENFDFEINERTINDSQLKMMFAICNPVLSKESQIAMALRILCGFGIDEIASAFLTSKQTINKRMLRGKQKFKEENIALELPATKELEGRTEAVLSVLYLLFNEGYYTSNSEQAFRKDLCYESMRLLYLLINNKSTNSYDANALMALFCFHASRFKSRVNEHGKTILYRDQDQNLWDKELVEKGEYFMKLSVKPSAPSKYQLEAAIAFWHTKPRDTEKKWAAILHLYNRLLQIDYSPMAALNRTYALFKVHGRKKALSEALKINLKNNHLYHGLLAELYGHEDISASKQQLELALACAKNNHDKNVLLEKLNMLNM